MTEWKLFTNLPFRGLEREDIELVRLMYTMRLNKHRPPDIFNEAEEVLTTKYKLIDNPDVLLAKGDLLFAQCRFQECLSITTKYCVWLYVSGMSLTSF